MKDPLKYRVHQLLKAEPELLALVSGEAIGTFARPQSSLELAWREGRRSLAAEWLSLYQQVENERAG